MIISKLVEKALLITIHAPEITRFGLTLPIPETFPGSPEYLLYRAIEKKNSENAHSAYNALNRRITSFVHSLDQLASAN